MQYKNTLDTLSAFVKQEHEANIDKLFEVWETPLSTKLKTGKTQAIQSIKIEDNKHLTVTLGDNESYFREGDMICFHHGEASTEAFIRQATIEAEQDGEWLIRAEYDRDSIKHVVAPCYADRDVMDLRPFFNKALEDVAATKNGCDIILPLLAGDLDASLIYDDNYDAAADIAELRGFNDPQVDAVAKGVAAKYLACIQGPPGTGKTAVIGLIAKLLADEGQSILLTSHTHMAINNALNTVAKQGVAVIKVGANSSIKGLDKSIKQFNHGDDWDDRPDKGYVIGATPFATCSARLDNFDFDTVIVDEASQITVALAVMAMRKARRFVFVGDHKQLPPVVLSKSILDSECYSVFSQLISANQTVSVMLNQSYRMNAELTYWPSQQYYNGELKSAGKNAQRLLDLNKAPAQYQDIFAKNKAFIYIKSPGISARTHSKKEAELVVDLIKTANDCGIKLCDIGVVSPYRSHGKAIRNLLATKLGIFTAKEVVADTVERMQGQQRELIIVSLCSTDLQFIHAIAGFFFRQKD
ncbi:MAG: ATP-binding protein [Pseudomonadota bacterium]